MNNIMVIVWLYDIVILLDLTGFSSEVNKMLFQAAKFDTCPEREKNIILDEMHI